MKRCSMICLLVIVVGGMCSPTHAIMYKYRDAQGQLHITNVKPPDDTQGVTQYKERRSSTHTRPAWTYIPQPTYQPKATRSVTTPANIAPHTSRSRAVDTRKLGLIQRGMSQTEVQRRLGPPADVINLGYRTYTRFSHRHHTKNSRTTRLEKWVYPGNYSYPPAGIIFENGRVRSRGRE